MKNKLLVLISAISLSIGFTVTLVSTDKSGLIDDLNKQIVNAKDDLESVEKDLQDAKSSLEEAKVEEEERLKKAAYIEELEKQNENILEELENNKNEIERLITEKENLNNKKEIEINDLQSQIDATSDEEEKVRLELLKKEKLIEQKNILDELLRLELEEENILNMKIEKDEIILYIENHSLFEYIYDFDNKLLIKIGLRDDINLPETLEIASESHDIDLGDNTITYTDATNIISKEMFSGKLEGVKNIVIGEGIEIIETNAFSKNDTIESVELPNSLLKINQNAFSSNNINKIKFGNKLEYIGNEAFYGNDLIEITIPNSVTSIGDKAFYENISLSKVIISNSLLILDIEAIFDSRYTTVEGIKEN